MKIGQHLLMTLGQFLKAVIIIVYVLMEQLDKQKQLRLKNKY